MLSHAHPELENAEYVVFADASRRYVDCSEGVCRLLGYTREELLRKTIDDISYELDEVPRLFAEFLQSGSMEGEYVLQRKDQTPVVIRYRAFVFSDGCTAAIWEPTQGWKESYIIALLEFDPTKLKKKVEIALEAIRRTRETPKARSQTTQEKQALEDAAVVLHSLLKDIARSTQAGH